jgi:hypothetical protein
MRHTVLTVPGVTPQSFPWDYPLPRLLYKYLRPERLSVLTKCLIRFSQRQAFDDIFDLRPAAGSFGSDDEIAHYMEMQTIPPENQQEVLKHIRELGPRFAEFTVSRLKVPDEFGVLCLTDNPPLTRCGQFMPRIAAASSSLLTRLRQHFKCLPLLGGSERSNIATNHFAPS